MKNSLREDNVQARVVCVGILTIWTKSFGYINIYKYEAAIEKYNRFLAFCHPNLRKKTRE